MEISVSHIFETIFIKIGDFNQHIKEIAKITLINVLLINVVVSYIYYGFSDIS